MRRAALALALAAACDRAPDRAPVRIPAVQHAAGAVVDTTGLRALAVPAELRAGEASFDTRCAQCHGQAALGTGSGPPLVHTVYEPSHHGDAAFVRAAQRGVRAHHWSFGDMPPVPGVSQEEVLRIVAYVRWLQRQAGVY